MTVLDQNKAHHRFFEELTKIPHGSHEEKQMSDFLVNFAKERGLDYYQDDIHNVIIYKKATVGYGGKERGRVFVQVCQPYSA